MATRFYGWEAGTTPITPAADAGWESSAAPFARRPMHTTARFGDNLATVTGFTSTAAQDRCHRQWISRPMAAGNAFTTSTTFKAYAQVLETTAGANLFSRLCVRVLSQDGLTVRATLLAIADYSTAVEWNTAIRNKAFADGDVSAANYTTVDGDRLVVEWGHRDSAGASISASSRWGSTTTTTIADLGENETSTSTTERPWFETSLNITFKAPTVVDRYLNTASTAGGDGTTNGTTGTTRAFESMSASFVALRATDWPTNNQRVVLHCTGTAADVAASTVTSGTIHSTPDCYLLIEGDAPNALQYSTSSYRMEPVKGAAPFINSGCFYYRTSRLQAKGNPGDGAAGYATFNIVGVATPEPGDCRADRCHVTAIQNNTNTTGYFGFWGGSVNPNVKATHTNCVANGFIGTGNANNSGFKKDVGATTDMAWYNCTAYNCSIGYHSATNNVLAKNCGASACTDGFQGTFAAGTTNCASSLAADATGTNARNSVTPTFVSAGSDFHLASGDTAWTDFGIDLSADARVPFSTDGDGATRTGTWDIGADELTSIATTVQLAAMALAGGLVIALAGTRVPLQGSSIDIHPRITADISIYNRLTSAVRGNSVTTASLTSRVALVSAVRTSSRTTSSLTTRLALYPASALGSPRVTGNLRTALKLQSVAEGHSRSTASLTSRLALSSSVRSTSRTLSTVLTRVANSTSVMGHGRLTASLSSRQALSSSTRVHGRALSVMFSRVALSSSAKGHPRVVSLPSTKIALGSTVRGQARVTSGLRTRVSLLAVVQGQARIESLLGTRQALSSKVIGHPRVLSDLRIAGVVIYSATALAHGYVAGAPLFVWGGVPGVGSKTEVLIIAT